MFRSGVEFGRRLRREGTPHERKLWRFLRAKQFEGLKFRRQHEIGPYLVDFCCPEKKVVIELDGGGHGEEDQKQRDETRDAYLEQTGYKVIRIWNHELQGELEAASYHFIHFPNRFHLRVLRS